MTLTISGVRLDDPLKLVKRPFLCTMEGRKGIYECEVMQRSPDMQYVELYIKGNLQHTDCFQWVTRYEFERKMTVLAWLQNGEGAEDAVHI